MQCEILKLTTLEILWKWTKLSGLFKV